MHKQFNANRRNVLRTLGSLPVAGYASWGASVLGTSAQWLGTSTAHASDLTTPQIAFTPTAAANLNSPELMASVTTSSKLQIKQGASVVSEQALSYHTLFMTGDPMPQTGGKKSVIAGGLYDINHQPIMDTSTPGQERQMFSDAPDGTSLLQVGGKLFAVVQFEYITRDLAGNDGYGRYPSTIAVVSLEQDKKSGLLKPKSYHPVNTSSVHGLWITCAASLSPWNTHLSSEEYEPDAFAPKDSKGDKQFKAFAKNLYGDAARANPYPYGHVPEVTVQANGTASIKKHYGLGRISRELVQVMPDERTVLMGDDTTNGGIFMFVADKARDLSSGNLYAAKLAKGFSVNPADAAVAIRWIHLGHASSAQIEKMAQTLQPSDIMDVVWEEPKEAGFTKVYLNGVANWVRVKPNMDIAAAFLETHRYAYLKGASLGFSKMEGVALNPEDKTAYLALAYIQDSMAQGGKGWVEGADISLDKALKSGGVMALPMKGRVQDASGNIIESEWVAVQAGMALVGEDLAAADELGNTSEVNKVANPDNINYSSRMRTLFIGEDSGRHVNNFVWAYHVDSKELVRIMSVPAGAECTGLSVVDHLNGWTYIMSNFQHAGDWEALHDKVKPKLDPMIRAAYKDRYGALVGYIAGQNSALKIG